MRVIIELFLKKNFFFLRVHLCFTKFANQNLQKERAYCCRAPKTHIQHNRHNSDEKAYCGTFLPALLRLCQRGDTGAKDIARHQFL